MRLELKDIGKVRHAEIDINGITVIAGENNSGKSTISRSLYSVFNGLSRIDEKITAERKVAIEQYLQPAFRQSSFADDSEFHYGFPFATRLSKRLAHTVKQIDTVEKLDDEVVRFLHEQGHPNPEEVVANESYCQVRKQVLDIFTVPEDRVLSASLTRQFTEEFYGQINNLKPEGPSVGGIILSVQNQIASLSIKNDKVKLDKGKMNLSTEAVYLDDPYILDMLSVPLPVRRATTGHAKRLVSLLDKGPESNSLFGEIIAEDKIKKIIAKLDSLCDGEIVHAHPRTLKYKTKGSENDLDLRNLSAGLKTFVILKTLILNGTIQNRSTIILDEPEIHLHPEWQLVCAELIVLLQRTFNLHVLVTTHSPYFLEAIEVYSESHGIADECRYYLSENNPSGSSTFRDVTGRTPEIYKQLARPIDTLDRVRYRND